MKKKDHPNTGGIIGLNSTPPPRVTHLPATSDVAFCLFFLFPFFLFLIIIAASFQDIKCTACPEASSHLHIIPIITNKNIDAAQRITVILYV